jgi:DNA repair ATPase RecN
MKLLDAYCGSDLALAKYQKTYTTINQLKTSLKSKQQALAKIRSDSDYNNYLLEELQQFAPVEGEEEQLEKDMPELEVEKEAIAQKMIGHVPFEALQKLSERATEITKLLEEKETRWLELSE